MNISVIIPAYNAEETIGDTLDSLIAQTYPNWEAIVVDDGSNDGTVRLIRHFAERDARIRIIEQQNGGESIARNTGIAKAQHDWLLFLDSDDWISPLHLRRLTDELLSNAALDAIHCGSARVALDGTLTIEEYQPPSGDMFPTLARRSAFPIHACLVRKKFVVEVGKFDISYKKSSDWDLWQRIARTGAHFGTVREILAFYRTRPNSASVEAHPLLREGLRILRQGHSSDPRVKNPHPNHAKGQPKEQIRTQEFYLLSWCAGLLLGAGKDARSLLKLVKSNYPELYADAVAQCIFESAPLPTGRALHEWEELWPHVEPHIDKFLSALEAQSMSPELARHARNHLDVLIEKNSMVQQPITKKHELTLQKQRSFMEELKRDKVFLETERKNLQKLSKGRDLVLEQKQAAIERLKRDSVALKEEQRKFQQLAGEREKSLQTQQAFIGELEQDKQELKKERNEQRLVAKQQHKTLEKSLAAIEALKRDKVAIESKQSKFQQLAGEREKSLQTQRAFISELEQDKQELKKERNEQRFVAEQQHEALDKSLAAIEALKRDKVAIESKQNKFQQLAVDRAKSLQTHETFITNLVKAKRYLEKEKNEQRELANEFKQTLEKRQATIEKMKRSIAVLEEKRNKLYELTEERDYFVRTQRGTIRELKLDKRSLRKAWIEQRRLAENRQSLVAQLQGNWWVRIGLGLRFLQRPRDNNFIAPETKTSRKRPRLNPDVLTQLSRKAKTKLQMLQYLTEGQLAVVLHRLQLLRLRFDRCRSGILGSSTRHRVLATACWSFPYYSQTFVYQELTQLISNGFKVRFLYSKLNSRKEIPNQFKRLWHARRRLILHPKVCKNDYAYFEQRLPDKIRKLPEILSAASNMSIVEIKNHYHFEQAFAFARMVEAYRPDYLHSYFFYEGSLFAFIASYLLDIPRGISCYADHMLPDYALKLVPSHLKYCNPVIATSRRIKDELLRIAPQVEPERIIVKPNAINATQFPARSCEEPTNGQPFRLVSLSRIEPKKGLLYLVETVALLREQNLNIEWHHIGSVDGSTTGEEYSQKLHAKIADLKLGAIVHLEGRQSEDGIKRFFEQAHLFVAPFVETADGDKDGIPTSLLEGMASGLPVVATDAGSIVEVIEDGMDGIIVPQCDSTALAGTIAELLSDVERRTFLGRNGAKKVREKFDVTVCEHLFHSHLSEILRSD